MDLLSIILVALVVLWAVAAVVYLVRHRGSGCCGGGGKGSGGCGGRGGCDGGCGRCGGCRSCK